MHWFNPEERVKNVLNFKKRSKSITIVAAVLVLILGFGLLTSQAGENTGVPLIGNGFVFEIPHVEAGEVVLIGQLNLRPGVRYRYTFSAESGQGVFIALHRSPDIERDEDVIWFQLFGGGTINSSDGFGDLGFTGIIPQTVYVYIGSRGPGNTDLTKVTGRIGRNGFNLFNELREIFRDDETHNAVGESIIGVFSITSAAASGIARNFANENIDNSRRITIHDPVLHEMHDPPVWTVRIDYRHGSIGTFSVSTLTIDAETGAILN